MLGLRSMVSKQNLTLYSVHWKTSVYFQTRNDMDRENITETRGIKKSQRIEYKNVPERENRACKSWEPRKAQ